MARVIRRNVVETDRPIGVNNFDTDADAVGLAIQRAGETLRQKAFESDARKARVRGEEAAKDISADKFRAIGEDGKPEALTPPEGMGEIAREAYRQVAERRFVETLDADIQTKATELRVKFDRNPIGFQRAMDDYLKGLGVNAEGRFREFIEQNGTAVREANYYSLVQAERNRARQANAQHVVAENVKAEELAATLAYQGDTGAAIALANERRNATQEAEGAELRVGTGEAAYDSITGRIAANHYSKLALGLDRTERAELALMMQTNGNAKVSKSVQEIYNQTVEVTQPDGTKTEVKVSSLINSSNKRAVMTAVNATSADVYAVEQARLAKLERNRLDRNRRDREEARKTQDYYNTEIWDAERNARDNARQAFEDGSIAIALKSEAAALAILYEDADLDANSNPEFTQGQADAYKNEARKEVLAPYVVQAVSRGEDPDTLRSAILAGVSTKEGSPYSLLGKEGQALVRAIDENPELFDDNTIQDLSPLFSMSSSEAAQRIKKQTERVNFIDDAIDMSTGIYSGLYNSDDAGAFKELMRAAVATGKITAEDENRFVRAFNVNFARAEARSLATAFDSTSLNILAQFVRSGEDISDSLESLTDGQREKIKDALATVDGSGFTDTERGLIAEELTSVAKRKAADERVAADAAKERKFRDGFLQRTEDMTSTKAQDYAQTLVDNQGFDLSNRETWTPKVMAVMSLSIPTDLKNKFENLAKGVPIPPSEANNLMSLFGVLSNSDPLGGRNMLNGHIDKKDMAVLLTVQNGIANELYRSVEEAITVTNQALRDSPTKTLERENAVFVDKEDQKGGTISPKKWVDGVLENAGLKGDFILNAELGEVARHLARIGETTPDQIAEIVVQMYNEEYAESAYVFDPSRPLGQKTRSRHAMGAIFKDERVAKHVINKINTTLRDHGYTLFNPIDGTSIDHSLDPLERDRLEKSGQKTGLFAKRAVLVPLFPYAADQSNQVFTLMSPVPLPDGTTELAQVIIDDVPVGFRVTDEAADWKNPDFEDMKGMTYEDILERVELIEMIGKDMPL